MPAGESDSAIFWSIVGTLALLRLKLSRATISTAFVCLSETAQLLILYSLPRFSRIPIPEVHLPCRNVFLYGDLISQYPAIWLGNERLSVSSDFPWASWGICAKLFFLVPSAKQARRNAVTTSIFFNATHSDETMPEAVSPGPVVPQISHNNAAPNRDLIPMNLTAAQDKAFKREVMRHLDHSDVPIDGPLTNWLDRYMPTKRAPHPTPYFERLRANLVARKARVDALMALHARGDKHGRRWPRLRQIAEEEQKARHAAASKRKADVQARQEAAMAALVRKEERAAASARVALLMRQRASGRGPRFKPDRVLLPCHVAVPNIARVWYVLSLQQATDGPLVASLMAPPLAPDMIWEIAIASDSHTRCQLARLSSSAHDLVCSLIYRHISVGDEAGELIQSLVFRSSAYTYYINEAEWALVLPAMVNLRRLIVNQHVPLDRRVLPLITFRLHVFLSVCSVFGAWADFLASQPELEEIGLHSDLLGRAPGHSQLPMLRSVKGRPEDVARFARNHCLDDIWFWLGPPRGRLTLETTDLQRFALSPSHLLTLRIMAPHLLLLMEAAPSLLDGLLHLTLDEDLGWCRFNSKSVVVRAVRDLRERTPVLKSLTLTCAPALGRWVPRVTVADGANFCATFLALSRSSALQTFHFCGLDGCATWRNWGQDHEEVSYATLDDHGPWDLNPKYA
ncbi:hypothetical protein FB451DRAFT_1172061 [Mycena latifolia]|nr:hypothetical protein FB451DRAFT_1172061 [Mycena latifolia]